MNHLHNTRGSEWHTDPHLYSTIHDYQHKNKYVGHQKKWWDVYTKENILMTNWQQKKRSEKMGLLNKLWFPTRSRNIAVSKWQLTYRSYCREDIKEEVNIIKLVFIISSYLQINRVTSHFMWWILHQVDGKILPLGKWLECV